MLEGIEREGILIRCLYYIILLIEYHKLVYLYRCLVSTFKQTTELYVHSKHKIQSIFYLKDKYKNNLTFTRMDYTAFQKSVYSKDPSYSYKFTQDRFEHNSKPWAIIMVSSSSSIWPHFPITLKKNTTVKIKINPSCRVFWGIDILTIMKQRHGNKRRQTHA